ncbi:esterase [Enterococcus faecium]|nr:esterase [Enterococcus faecium]
MIVQLKKDYSSDHAFFITPPAVDETKQKYRNNKLIKEYISVLTEVAKRHDCEVSIFIRLNCQIKLDRSSILT